MLQLQRPGFLPDPALDRAEMESLQRELASVARFHADHDLTAEAVARAVGAIESQSLTDPPDSSQASGDTPIVAGVDQAFRGEEAVSAVVAMQNGEVVETVHAAEPAVLPYIPGLLSFREGTSIVTALEALSVEPDLLLLDGSGRIHYREAGIATHVGVLFDVPAIGVAKKLLCGTPERDTDGLETGERVPILADEGVTAPEGTLIGYAVQTRQFDSPNRYVNPVLVSPGHRIGAESAADVALAAAAGYKLPEPIRRADAVAGQRASS
jgi:deoxyribonuclease V